MQIQAVGVVGLGTMGSAIAEVIARRGYQVIGIDSGAEGLLAAQGRISSSIDRGVARGKISESEADEIRGRITFSNSLSDLSPCDLVIEAVPESLDTKKALLGEIDQVLNPSAILASNTSALSITELSVATNRPTRVIGIHFFNPATIQRFVEIVQTVTSDRAVIDSAVEFVQSLDKEPVVVDDRAGFIANALLFGYLNQAIGMYEENYASREDIDNAMRLGCGLPMGPLALLDLIGLDTSLEILEAMYDQSRDRLHAPHSLLKQLVTSGLLGRKTGKGFYSYKEPHSSEVIADSKTPESSGGKRDVPIKSVGVMGSGTMATGIASVFASAGIPVTLVTRSPEKSAAAIAGLRKSWDKLVEKGKITQEILDGYLSNLSSTESAHTLQVDLVIEAVAEDFDIKAELFRELDQILPESVILATTTSSLSVTELAAQTSRPSRFLGIHFFNPAAIMKLVEMVSTVDTDPAVVEICTQLVRNVGKTPVQCADRAGFIVNALLFPYLNNAIAMSTAKYASMDDIDAAMKLGCGYPMGPFELLDVVGLDVSLAILNTLYQEFREPGFAPEPELERLVAAGHLGRKVGRGFRTVGG